MTHEPVAPTGLRFSADSADLDHERVLAMLTMQAPWAAGRDRATQDAAIAGSLNFGVFDMETGRQVAYARVVSDRVTFAWLCDVIVDESARGRGAARMLMEGVMRHLRGDGSLRVTLTSTDARGLYTRFGFTPLAHSDRWMEIRLGSS